jgi:hypothetical protein
MRVALRSKIHRAKNNINFLDYGKIMEFLCYVNWGIISLELQSTYAIPKQFRISFFGSK